jgi:hypothetical protein
MGLFNKRVFFSAVKISVQGLGACGSGRDMFSGQDFLRLSILLFRVGKREQHGADDKEH